MRIKGTRMTSRVGKWLIAKERARGEGSGKGERRDVHNTPAQNAL